MAAFVDTNILIYAFATEAENEPSKVAVASALVTDLTLRYELVVSVQVLSEFSSNAMRKGTPPLTIQAISRIVETLSQQTVLSLDASLVQMALRRVQLSSINY